MRQFFDERRQIVIAFEKKISSHSLWNPKIQDMRSMLLILNYETLNNEYKQSIISKMLYIYKA